ncbi:MAG: hypothetical protein HND44_11930 [Chloroflexi bacterium]|nr:hypothetical protein [Ardenticatenaceae bacterium]MBL1129191.1 hypothetical protein [Chloroflexota bacterium]NOG35267.1 hypothetical protein [Chloroflexota bacterium]
MNKILLLLIIVVGTAVGCQQPAATPTPPPTAEPTATSLPPTPITPPLGAGMRYSRYGSWYDPGPDYWAGVAQQMAGYFPSAVPQAVWIVGTVGGQGTALNFPGQTDKPYIYFTSQDKNEEVLTLFDEMGGQVWLQVEPGHADVETLIHILLERYGRHPSVVGVGIDVEWYGSVATAKGTPVTDEVAQQWVAAARSHGEQYRIFLKHWLPAYMPPTYRDGLFFIDDSQGFASLEEMVSEFTTWGKIFAPSPVGFQYGYQSDRKWWQELENPPQAIGEQLITAVPHTAGLYWVDFTVLDMFPPER